MTKVKIFKKSVKGQGQRSQGPNFGFQLKGLAQGNIHVKYESPSSHGLEVMAKIKVFKKLLKGQGQRVQIFGSGWKVLSRGIYM